MVSKKQLKEKSEKIERKLKKTMKGCGDYCEKGGICYHMSRDKKLLFNNDLTDSKLERIRMYCDSCNITLFQLQAQLELLKELTNNKTATGEEHD